MNLELEGTGPAEYDLATVTKWLHDRQKHGMITGLTIYEYLTKHRMLDSCLGLQDALAIQKLGIAVFRKVFGDYYETCFWKAVVRHPKDGLCVLYMCQRDGQVVLGWSALRCASWSQIKPAARFRKLAAPANA